MLNTHGQYQSYLLRLYRPGPHTAWRVMLEAIPGREQQGFASLQEAFLFLETQSVTTSMPLSPDGELTPPPAATPGLSDQHEDTTSIS